MARSNAVLPPPPRSRGTWGDPTKVQIRRELAALIDLGLLPVVWLGYRLSGGGPLLYHQTVYQSGAAFRETGLTWGGVLWVFVVTPAYLVGVFVFQRGQSGKSVGMWSTRVRCVGPDGLPPGRPKALLRSVAGTPDYLFFGLLGVALIATSRGHRRLGDRAAATYVIAAEFAGRPVTFHRTQVGGPSEPPPPSA
jgi:uncharacterized RDD family membrane protein YckC